MEFIDIEKNPTIRQDKKLMDKYVVFEKLITELKKKEIPADVINAVNHQTGLINSFSGSDKDLKNQFRKSQADILKLIEKECKLVTKNHYRNRWLPLGMSAFGLPIGVALGISIGNLGLLGIGLPIGMAIGIGVGTAMDSKAKETGKQLDVEFK